MNMQKADCGFWCADAFEAVVTLLENMAAEGTAIASPLLAIELEKLLQQRWDDLSDREADTIAGAIVALILAPPMLGPIDHDRFQALKARWTRRDGNGRLVPVSPERGYHGHQ
ncbi:MAG: hypothetical protein KBE25_11140 [Laribacter sp.]|nr:hypothetical protein [Laribacter sp.]MBP9609880.1 hypothetical protein [Laribacter sp.]